MARIGDTHYQTLGVSRLAGASEVRAAYLALMKLHHPDVASRSRSGIAPEDINAAFAVLKDPHRRRRYDAELFGGQSVRPRFQPAPPPRSANAARGRAAPARRRLHAFLVAMAAGTAAAGMMTPVPSGRATASESRAYNGRIAVQEVKEPAASLPSVRSGDVQDSLSDFEWIVSEHPATELVTYSEDCFSRLARQPDLRLLDRCVSFDLAAKYLLPANTPVASNFSGAPLRARHAAAVEFLPRKPATARLRQLDRMTLSQIAISLEPGDR